MKQWMCRLSLAVQAFTVVMVLTGSWQLIVAQDNAVTEARDKSNKAVKAFTEQKFEEAAELFKKAIELDPNFETARMYLGVAYTSQFVPGSTDPGSQEMAYKAIETFRYVADNSRDQNNRRNAALSVSNLFYQLKKYKESRDWCHTILQIDPQNAEAYYRIAVIDFDISLEKTGIQGELVASMSADERTASLATIDEGLESLDKALELQPGYFDAMEYKNLLLREKAKFENDANVKAELIGQANQIAQKALDIRLKTQKQQRSPE